MDVARGHVVRELYGTCRVKRREVHAAQAEAEAERTVPRWVTHLEYRSASSESHTSGYTWTWPVDRACAVSAIGRPSDSTQRLSTSALQVSAEACCASVAGYGIAYCILHLVDIIDSVELGEDGTKAIWDL